MPTLSIDICYCGAEKRAQEGASTLLYCPHCDRPCRVQQNTGEACPRCETRNEYWNKKIAEIYGPGRGN